MGPQETHRPPSAGLQEEYCTTGVVPDWWNLDTKGNAVKNITNFRPIIPRKCRWGNIFCEFWSSYQNLSDEKSLYKYICSEGWNTWLPRMFGTFRNDIELNTLSEKGQNRTTYNLAWSCQCIRFNSAPLNPNGPRLFQLPWQGWRNHNEILQFSRHEIYR